MVLGGIIGAIIGAILGAAGVSIDIIRVIGSLFPLAWVLGKDLGGYKLEITQNQAGGQ